MLFAGQDRVAVWTRDANNEPVVEEIGKCVVDYTIYIYIYTK